MLVYYSIKGKNIFFSDEKKLMRHRYSNTQNNRVRLTKESQQALREGDYEIADLLNEPVKTFEKGFMVAGGISYFGFSKLIF